MLSDFVAVGVKELQICRSLGGQPQHFGSHAQAARCAVKALDA